MNWMIACIASFLLILASPSFATEKDKISYRRALYDEVIESDFEDGLRWQDDRFEATRVKVKAFNGYVLIYGEVPEKDLTLLAEKHAKKLKHVRRVFNQIHVAENQNPSTLDDLLLTSSIKSHLWSSTSINATKVHYEVDGNTVYLMGLVTSEEAQKTVELVKKIKSVDRVITLFEYIQ